MFLHDTAHSANKWLDGWHVETLLVAALGMIIFAWVAFSADTDAVLATGTAVVALSPLWLPVALFFVFWKIWIHYIRYTFWFKTPMVLLHIELPAEVTKSPMAMEVFLLSLWNAGGETTFIQRIWKGQFRAITTLELVSNEGRIGYYIHLRKNWKDLVEARLYGQYPEAKITEVPDYMDEVGYTRETHELWATEYTKGEAHAVPIRTYVDYQLDKDTDTPEVTVDPLSNTFELFSDMGPGEYMWVQIVMKARKKDEWYGFYTGDSFVDDAKAKIKAMIKEAADRAQSLVTGNDPKAEERRAQASARGLTLLTTGEKDKVEAIERSLTKMVFDCGIRVAYLAKKENFNYVRIGTLIRFFDAFRFPTRNSLGVARGMQIFDYPWQDFRNIRRDFIRDKFFFWYKHRAYFYVPYDQDAVCMTTEELASLWHFPDSSVKTPALQRVPSRRSSAPSNLPI